MLDIIIIAIGAIKEKYFKEAYQEYLKRLKPYARISVQEFPYRSFSEIGEEKIKKEEGEKIMNYLEKYQNKTVIALDEHGRGMTSVDFSKFLFRTNGPVIFIIGGSLGLSKDILSHADHVISFSNMTFPHEMARVILAEQIYRAVTIEKGKNYHL